MKTAFFEIKDWEAAYLKERLPDQDLQFFTNVIDMKNLPTERGFEIISIFTGSKIDKPILDSFPNLKLIASRTTGIDHIDQESTKAVGVVVKNVPTYGENTVAEFAFALLLSLSRRVLDSAMRVKNKGSFTSDGLQGFDLAGKTIGVVGTGHIGQHVIKIANGFGMKVIGFDVVPNRVLESQLNFQYQ